MIVAVVVVGALLMALLGVVSTEGGVRFALVILVAYTAVVVVSRVLEPYGRVVRASRQKQTRTADVAGLVFVERAARQVDLASGSAVQFERLRLRLRVIAEQRLVRHGLRFESDGARSLLGDEAWVLLERPLERDKFAPGPTPTEIELMLTALEKV